LHFPLENRYFHHMLVLSRVIGESIHVRSKDDTCVVTLMNICREPPAITVMVNRAVASRPGFLETRTFNLKRDGVMKLNDSSDMTLVDATEDKARLGINAPKESSVHRLEVYQAIARENRGRDQDDGPAGSRVPRPDSPKPPSFDVRLEEPPAADGGGG
jgi:carbon storage regulator CsrA